MTFLQAENEISFAIDVERDLPKVLVSGSFSPEPIPLHVTAFARTTVRLQNIEHEFTYLINDQIHLDPNSSIAIRNDRPVHVIPVHNIQPLGDIRDMKQWNGPSLRLREIIATVQRNVLSANPFNQLAFEEIENVTWAKIAQGFDFGGDCVALTAKMYVHLKAMQIPAYIIPCKTEGAVGYNHVAIIVPFFHQDVEKGFALVDVGLHLPVPLFYREPLLAPGSSNTPLFNDSIKLRNVWYELECHTEAREFKLHSGQLPKRRSQPEKVSTYYFCEIDQTLLIQLFEPEHLREKRIIFYDDLGDKMQELNFSISRDKFQLKWNQKTYHISHDGNWINASEEKDFFESLKGFFSEGFKKSLKISLIHWSERHRSMREQQRNVMLSS